MVDVLKLPVSYWRSNPSKSTYLSTQPIEPSPTTATTCHQPPSGGPRAERAVGPEGVFHSRAQTTSSILP